jgi:hypothetical protein
VFIILKQRIDTIKVETDVSVHNQEDVIGIETDEVCVPQECEPELLRLVDLQSCLCVWSFASVSILRVDKELTVS